MIQVSNQYEKSVSRFGQQIKFLEPLKCSISIHELIQIIQLIAFGVLGFWGFGVLGFGIWDWELGLGIGDWELEIWIGIRDWDWDWGLGLGIGIGD